MRCLRDFSGTRGSAGSRYKSDYNIQIEEKEEIHIERYFIVIHASASDNKLFLASNIMT